MGLERLDVLGPSPAAGSWAPVRISQRVGRADELRDDSSWCTETAARIRIGPDMYAEIDRHDRSATLIASRACDAELLVHPFLTAPGAAFAWWEGREALHGGAFLAGEGCFAMLGEKGAGKSSTLVELALRGRPVLCDDLLVLRGDLALAGPRCLDLDPAVAERPELREVARDVGRAKRRLALSSCSAEAPLRGCFYLAWGERVELMPLSPSERLRRLAGARAISGARGRQGSLLDLTRLPAWELRRPHSLSSLEPCADQLLALVAAGGEPRGLER